MTVGPSRGLGLSFGGGLGLDLGGRRAEDIALSILAEITAVAHGRPA